MAVVKLYLSGGAGNKFPVTSLGGVRSTTEIVAATLNNLFDDTTRVEIINGRTEYRCFYIKNESGGDFMRARFINLVIPPTVEAEFSFAVNTKQSTPEQLVTEDQTPAGLTFYKFRDWRALEIAIGVLDDTEEIAIWVKRKVLAGSDTVRMVDFDIDGQDNTFVPTQDFFSVESSHDNDSIRARDTKFFTDIDFVGESLTS